MLPRPTSEDSSSPSTQVASPHSRQPLPTPAGRRFFTALVRLDASRGWGKGPSPWALCGVRTVDAHRVDVAFRCGKVGGDTEFTGQHR